MSQKLCQKHISGQAHNILVLLTHMFKNCPLNDHVDITNKISFCLFVALRPKSTAMVMAGWSVHLTTLFPGQARKQLTSTSCTYFRL